MRLTFLPRPPPPGPRKRTRAVADIDGENSCTQKKKRRLRLFLITSRLSPQFSYPATNIVDRGSSKIAVWAKQKALGRNLLRKAAILNGIRRRSILARDAHGVYAQVLVEQEKEEAQLELARLEFHHGSVDTYTRPVHFREPSVPPRAAVRTGDHFVVAGSPSPSPNSSRSPSPTPPASPKPRALSEEKASFRSPNEAFASSLPRGRVPRQDYLPLPPSPLGLSNYDVFDIEDDASDPYAHLDDEDEPIPNPYDDEDDDDDAVPFSPSAITVSSSTIQTRTTHATTHSGSNVLVHGEPVFGDYDQVEEGASATWPRTTAQEISTSIPLSASPDFPALFTTSPLAPKRTDSFAMSPNFRPYMPTKSVSPNIPHATVVPCTSPSLPPSTSMSPNFPPVATSPNFASAVATRPMSPSFIPSSPHLVPLCPNLPPVPMSSMFTAIEDDSSEIQLDKEYGDFEQERRRQRGLMFMRFES